MARIKLGALISDIRGAIKEQVFSIWKTGVHYVRSKAGIISNPQSRYQDVIRQAMTVASKEWFDTLTVQQRDNWNEFASGLTPKEGGGGGILNIIPQNRGIMSGFNAYCMAWAMVERCGLIHPGTFADSPLGATPPEAPVLTAVSHLAGTVTIDWDDPDIVEAGAEIRIWTRSRQNICHRQMRTCVALALGTFDNTSFRGANGATILYVNAPGHYLFQLDCIQLNGLKSPPSETREVIVA